MMDEIDRAPELDELVSLLRGATPDAATIASARAATISAAESAAFAPWPSWMNAALRFTIFSCAIVGLHGAQHLALAEIEADPVEIESAPIARAADEAPAIAEPAIAPAAEIAEVAAEVVELVEIPPPTRIVRARRRIEARPVTIASAKKQEPLAAPVASPPSEVMAEALRDYANERYAEAAVGFQRVVDGTSDDSPDRFAQGEFFLAKCLYHMGLIHAAAAAFDEVTRRGREHPYFAASLRWLAMLAERLPEESGVIESIGRYDAEELRELDRDETRAHYHHLLYLLGRARYAERRLPEAIALFRGVPDETRYALEARFFEGVSHVRAHHARPALAAFRRVIDSVRSGRTGGHEDPERLFDLAWMSVARLYYSNAMQVRDDDRASEQLTLAIAAWRRIPLGSEYWLDSFFEETWALYVARQYGRALGHVHALESPFFRDRANPEALVLRAMIFFEHCQWDAVERSVERFHARFDPMSEDLETVDRMASTNEGAFRVLAAVHLGRSRVPPRVLPAVRAALQDREIARALDQVRSIAREEERLADLGPPVLETSLHARVVADLAVVRSIASDRAGQLARARIHRLREEMDERLLQIDTVEVELHTQRRQELTSPNNHPMGPADGGRIIAVQGDQIWPFDGEWWRDELPFYIQEVQNRCAR
jgi:TolA-binding protein